MRVRDLIHEVHAGMHLRKFNEMNAFFKIAHASQREFDMNKSFSRGEKVL